MNNGTWAVYARRVIAGVMKANPDVSGAELRTLLRDAYPFGERKYHPYRVWCKEVRKALGIKRTQPALPLSELPLFKELA